MENFDATPLHLHDAHKNLGDANIELDYLTYKNKGYVAKLKHYLRRISVMVQKAILWVTFLYIPVFGVLLYLKVTTFVSIFSLYYFISYFAIIIAFIMINREEHTFR